MNDLVRRLLCLPEQASSVARAIDHLHYFVIGVTMVGSGGVGFLALYYVVRYRRRPGIFIARRGETSTTRELLVAGSILTLFIGFWIIGYRQYVELATPPPNAMDVYVTAKQWMWKFAYPNGSSSIGILTVPRGRPVRLLMTSRDVIHSFFVPAFRIKRDVLPGRYVTTWFEAVTAGSYDVLCTEYCGVSHSRMRAEVVVLEPADHALWLAHNLRRDDADTAGDALPAARQTALPDRVTDMATQGRIVATRRSCLACHTVTGQPLIGPSWRGLFNSWVTLADGRVVLADEAYLTRSMMDPQTDVVAGFATVMPTYRGSLEPAEAAALIEFIKSLDEEAPASAVDLPRLDPRTITPGLNNGNPMVLGINPSAGGTAVPGAPIQTTTPTVRDGGTAQ